LAKYFHHSVLASNVGGAAARCTIDNREAPHK